MPPVDPTAGTDPTIQPNLPLASANVTPAFDPKDVMVVFLLGGPGSGKGTQAVNLVQDYGFKHLSAGDLLRDEQKREGSQYGQMINDYIKEGLIVPMEVTVKLLENAMHASLDASKSKPARFLVDGFPRKMDQAVYFEQSVCQSQCTVYLDCPLDLLQERLLNRGKTSGRADDNEESIKKRFKTFIETSKPVVDMYEKEGKVISISATGTPNEVYERLVAGLSERGISPTK